jgi:hypothetical protein
MFVIVKSAAHLTVLARMSALKRGNDDVQRRAAYGSRLFGRSTRCKQSGHAGIGLPLRSKEELRLQFRLTLERKRSWRVAKGTDFFITEKHVVTGSAHGQPSPVWQTTDLMG